jgi:hypothetical protein
MTERNARARTEKQVLRCAQNDNQKSKSNGKRRSRSLRDDSQKDKGNSRFSLGFFLGMTERKATATTKARNAGVYPLRRARCRTALVEMAE